MIVRVDDETCNAEKLLTAHIQDGDAEFLPGPSVFSSMNLTDDFFEFIQSGIIRASGLSSLEKILRPTLLSLWGPCNVALLCTNTLQVRRVWYIPP
jgi:hypothetical protein